LLPPSIASSLERLTSDPDLLGRAEAAGRRWEETDVDDDEAWEAGAREFKHRATVLFDRFKEDFTCVDLIRLFVHDRLRHLVRSV